MAFTSQTCRMSPLDGCLKAPRSHQLRTKLIGEQTLPLRVELTLKLTRGTFHIFQSLSQFFNSIQNGQRATFMSANLIFESSLIWLSSTNEIFMFGFMHQSFLLKIFVACFAFTVHNSYDHLLFKRRRLRKPLIQNKTL